MASDSIKGSEAHIDLYHSLDIVVVNFPHCAGTFQPVKTDNIKDHTMHSEYYEISQDNVDRINQTKANGGRAYTV
jgi:S-adenosylmethionine:tRNA ribosyltransferase-isomerase